MYYSSIQGIPEELQAAVPGILNNGAEILTTGYLYLTELKPLDTIARHLANGVTVSPDVVNTLLNNCSNTTFVTQNKDAIFQVLTSNEACSDAVRQGMQDVMGSASNKILLVGIVSAGICAAIEGYKALKFWELIKDARNLIERSPGQREEISKQLGSIKTILSRLDKAIEDMRRPEIDKDDFECAKLASEHFINEIRIGVEQFLKQIGKYLSRRLGIGYFGFLQYTYCACFS